MKEKVKSNNIHRVINIVAFTIIAIFAILFIKFMLSPARGKDYVFAVEDYNFDGEKLDEALPWNTNPRLEMRDYMEENNLVLKPGEYKIYQGISFEDALEIFEFVEIEE